MSVQNLVLALLLAGVGAAASAQQTPWHHQARLQLGVEQDSNIKESAQGTQAAPSLRLLLDLGARRQLATGTVHLSLQGGCQAYWQHVDEDKVVGELRAGAAWPVGSKCSLGARASLRLKSFLREGPDYHHFSLAAFAQTRLPAQTALGLSCTRERLDYAASSIYDTDGWNTEVTVTRPLTAWVSAVVILGTQHWSLDRPAFAYDRDRKEWQALPQQHVDRVMSGGGRLELHTCGQWAIAYLYEKSSSNSYGYSFCRHRVSLLAGVDLSRRDLLRIYALLQRKRYEEAAYPALPLGLDTEREQSNVLVLDLSHTLANGYTAILRLARYDNESLVRGRYYQKSVVSLSFERRL